MSNDFFDGFCEELVMCDKTKEIPNHNLLRTRQLVFSPISYQEIEKNKGQTTQDRLKAISEVLGYNNTERMIEDMEDGLSRVQDCIWYDEHGDGFHKIEKEFRNKYDENYILLASLVFEHPNYDVESIDRCIKRVLDQKSNPDTEYSKEYLDDLETTLIKLKNYVISTTERD